MHVSNTDPQRLSDIKSIVFSAFEQIDEKIDVRTPRTFLTLLILFLSIKGKINFLQLERFSGKSEQGFRYFFEKSFAFFSFNKALIALHVQGNKALAFDPSYISKSGKKTAGVGYFWSGCSARAKWGLELCGLAVLDLTRRTAFHLFCFQTIGLLDDESLIQFYARKLLTYKNELLSVSKYMIADAYFSKISFVHPLKEVGFHIISRLRDDADLQYIHTGKQKNGRGRKRKYGGKVSFQNISEHLVSLVSELENEKIYSFKAYSKSLKMILNLVLVYTKNKNGKWSHKIYFSTDLEQIWSDVLEMYRLRFQIEFLYRDAKQFTGLNDCEARCENKLNFHWNMSLTTINIAKIAHWIPKYDDKKKENKGFSMSDVKTLYNNKLMIDRFIRMFGINPELKKNKFKIKQLLRFGKIAA